MNLEPPPILPLIFELDSTIIVLSVVISILLILSALFSGAETAFFSLTPKDNETLEQSTAEKENKTRGEVEGEFFRKVRTSSLLERFASVEEIANTITYYSSPLSAATNGAVIKLDGGSMGGII